MDLHELVKDLVGDRQEVERLRLENDRLRQDNDSLRQEKDGLLLYGCHQRRELLIVSQAGTTLYAHANEFDFELGGRILLEDESPCNRDLLYEAKVVFQSGQILSLDNTHSERVIIEYEVDEGMMIVHCGLTYLESVIYGGESCDVFLEVAYAIRPEVCQRRNLLRFLQFPQSHDASEESFVREKNEALRLSSFTSQDLEEHFFTFFAVELTPVDPE